MVHTLILGTICVDIGMAHTQSQERHPGLHHQHNRAKKMVYCQSLLPRKIISSEAYDLGGKKLLNLVLREASALTQSAVIAQRSHHRLLRAVFL